jgi:iron complex outermembrane recepter protein
MERSRRQPIFGLILSISGAATSAGALEESTPAAPALPEVLVIATTPVPGASIDADKVPGNVQSLSSAAIAENGTASLTSALGTRLASVNINDTLADPFQADILYRGFEA